MAKKINITNGMTSDDIKKLLMQEYGVDASQIDDAGWKELAKDLDAIKDKLEDINKSKEELTKKGYEEDDIKKIQKAQEGLSAIETILNNIPRYLKEINKEQILQERAINRQNDLWDLQVKKIRQGLTLDEKKHAWLIKHGEAMGMNTDKITTGVQELKNVGTRLKSIYDNWAKIDQAATDYTRHIGGSAQNIARLRKETLDLVNAQNLGLNFNVNAEELIKLQAKYNTELGRSVKLTDDQKVGLAAMKSSLGDESAIEFTTKLENFGLDTNEVEKRVGRMFGTASKHGVAFEKTSKNFLSNIQMANSFTFKNGLNGLASMAEKATAIKLDMQQVARAAEKVSTLEGAMGAGAQLSVLGGGFAQFGNPLTMMYEGLNDMEGLQDRIVKMFGGMGKWNMEKGQVDISVFNKQRIKAAAQAMGMDANNLFEMINTQARRGIVEKQLGTGLNKDTAELIKNQAQIDTETGRAYVTLDGEKKDVSKLTNADYAALSQAAQSDSENIRDIASNVRSFNERFEGFKKQQEDLKSKGMDFVMNTKVGDLVKSLTSAPWFVRMLAIGEGILLASSTANAVGNIGSGMFGGNGGASATNKGSLANSGGSMGNLASASNFANGSKWGKFATFGGSKTGLGRRAIGNIAKAGGYGKYVARGAGAGIGLGLAGAGIDYATNKAYEGKEKDNWYVAGKAGAKALEWAGIGAAVGSIIPGVGTLVGAGVGALAGGIYGGIQASRDKESERILRKFNKQGKVLNGQYDYDELKLMEQGKPVIQNGHPDLVNKMIQNGDWDKFAFGGKVRGIGSSTSDSVPILASNGEYVVSAKGVEKNLPVLEEINKGTKVMPVGDLMNSVNVVESNGANGSGRLSTKLEPITFEPLKIDLSGTLNIQVNGEMAKQIKPEELITPQVTDYIIREVQKRTEYGLRRQNLHEKYH